MPGSFPQQSLSRVLETKIKGRPYSCSPTATGRSSRKAHPAGILNSSTGIHGGIGKATVLRPGKLLPELSDRDHTKTRLEELEAGYSIKDTDKGRITIWINDVFRARFGYPIILLSTNPVAEKLRLCCYLEDYKNSA